LMGEIKSSAISTNHLEIGTLAQLAKTNRQLEMLERIRYEAIPDVRRMWIERFLETVRCPRCGDQLYKKGNEIRCRSCGFRIKM